MHLISKQETETAKFHKQTDSLSFTIALLLSECIATALQSKAKQSNTGKGEEENTHTHTQIHTEIQITNPMQCNAM